MVRAVGRVVALVRLVAGFEAADDAARRGVDRVHLPRGGGGHEQRLAIGRQRGVIGSDAFDRRAPRDLPRGEIDGDHVGKARTRGHQIATVLRHEHVVDQLVVALTRDLSNQREGRLADRVLLDLSHPLVPVGHGVDHRECVVVLGSKAVTVPDQLFPTSTTSRSSPVAGVVTPAGGAGVVFGGRLYTPPHAVTTESRPTKRSRDSTVDRQQHRHVIRSPAVHECFACGSPSEEIAQEAA